MLMLPRLARIGVTDIIVLFAADLMVATVVLGTPKRAVYLGFDSPVKSAG